MAALAQIILSQDQNITEKPGYGMPFFFYGGKRFCYIWYHKKHKKPYLGFVEGSRIEHPELLKEKRSRMKILLIDPIEDLPILTLIQLLKQAIQLATHPNS